MIQLGGNEVVIEDEDNTNTTLTYKDGIVRITSQGDSWGAHQWCRYLNQSNVEGIYLDCIGDNIMLSLPSNIKTVYVSDKTHLSNVKDWLTGESINHRLTNVTVEYVGNYTNSDVNIEKISPSITKFHIPLSEGIEEVLLFNPHLTSIGVDLDRYEGKLPLNTGLAVWSSNEHRLAHAHKIARVVKSSHFVV